MRIRSLLDGSATSSTYDAIGETLTTTDALNHVTRYAYDAAGRRISVTDALNHVTSFAYDAAGNQTAVTDANNHTTQFVYDAAGRRVQTISPSSPECAGACIERSEYDALGRQISKTDAAGKETDYAYDALGRLISVTDALGQVTRYAYDELGNRVSQTDANGHTTTFAYDQLGRRIRRTLPLGQTETYAYDAAGNLTARTDFNGRTTTYAYDSLNRLLSKTPDPAFAAAPIRFTYTPTGRRASMTDPSGTTTYAYDGRDRLITKAAPQGTLSYFHDSAGNLTQIRSSNAGGVDTRYTYDALNRISQTTGASDFGPIANTITNYGYDAVGNLASVAYPNGVTHAYSYDPLNRLTNLAVAKSTTALASYAYTLGPAGNRTGVTELSGRTVSYGYDNLYRLTSETISGSASQNGSISYTYDPVGNRTQLTSTVAAIPSSGLINYDANDRLTTDAYDNNGNTTVNASIGNAYDFENHLIQHGAVTIVYDGDGNRVAETVGGVTTKYLVDTQNPTGYAQVLEELVGSTVQRKYTYGLDLISENQLIGGSFKISFYGYDGHGSVRALTNNVGVVTDTYDYDAFGNLINQTGTTLNNYLFAGEQFDPALGLYYDRARYLDVRNGRFWGMDTFEGSDLDPGSLHKYLYVTGNPVNVSDPSGRDGIADVAAAIAVSFVVAALTVVQSGCLTSCSRRPLLIRVGVEFANNWELGKDALTEPEKALIKGTAFQTLREAYRVFGVFFSEGRGGDRLIIVDRGLFDGVGETTFFSRRSSVHFDNLYYTLLNVLDCNDINTCKPKSRTEMVEGLGRGIGATAAHELGHQANFGFSGDIQCDDCYDSHTSQTFVHFFGNKHWSNGALAIMRQVLPSAGN